MRTNRRDGRRRLPTTFQPFAAFGYLLLISLLLDLPFPALATPGDFDPSLDADGRVLSHFGGFEEALTLLVQSDGKLVAGGFSNATNFSSNDFALARYNPDGSLDTSFGTGGRVLTAFGGQDVTISLVQQADGKLVAAGGSNVRGDLDFALARYNPDGSLDPSFGAAGLILTGFGGGEERADALIQQADGKLVAAGVTRIGDSASPGNFALARYNQDGSLDPSFDSNGRVLTTFGADRDDVALALLQQPDGQLVAAGGTNGAFALVRYNPDGSLDTSFGNGGGVLTRFGGAVTARALVRQPDGKLVAAGESSASGAPDFTLARYNPDGSLDTSFGVGGRVVTDFGGNSDDVAEELVLQPDGKLVAAGGSNAAGRFDVALARYLPNGSLDATFGAGGLVRTDFGSTFPRAIIGLALQTDAKVVTAGRSDASGDADFALARHLLTDEQPRPPPMCGGRPATILGTAGADTMRGTLGRDVILGLAGNDMIRGLAGNDTICGGAGRDTLIGGDGNDRLFGVSGKDRLFGDRGRDRLDGGTGRDRCRGGQGRNTTIRCEDRNAPPPQRPQDPRPPTENTCPPISNTPCGLE